MDSLLSLYPILLRLLTTSGMHKALLCFLTAECQFISPLFVRFTNMQIFFRIISFDLHEFSFSNKIDPVFYYHAAWAMSKLKLKSDLAEYIAGGLLIVLIDLPFDIIGIKYVHWIWHDTDPNLCTFITI